MIQSFLVRGGECFIFEEQVPGDVPQDPRLLLDLKIEPRGKKEGGRR